MSILQRLWLITRSYVNHILGKTEDPEKMLNQMLMDMEGQLMSAKRQVAIAISDEKKLLLQYQKSTEKMHIWKEKAGLAVQANRDDLAKEALKRCTIYAKDAKKLEEHWKNQKTAVEQLISALGVLSNKINNAKIEKNLLVARAKRAEAEQKISTTMSNLTNNKNTINAIDRMAKKIDQMEIEANAASIMAKEIEVDELNAQFDKLEINSSENELQKLKKQLSSGSSKKINQLDNKGKKQINDIEKEIKGEKITN